MSAHQRRILVVEDERTIAESIAARLRAEGFAVELAKKGLAPAPVDGALRGLLGVLAVLSLVVVGPISS